MFVSSAHRQTRGGGLGHAARSHRRDHGRGGLRDGVRARHDQVRLTDARTNRPPPGPPPSIGYLRAQGVTHLRVSCSGPNCHHGSDLTFDALCRPDDTPFPSIATRRRWKWQRCGSRKASVMPRWPRTIAHHHQGPGAGRAAGLMMSKALGDLPDASLKSRYHWNSFRRAPGLGNGPRLPRCQLPARLPRPAAAEAE